MVLRSKLSQRSALIILAAILLFLVFYMMPSRRDNINKTKDIDRLVDYINGMENTFIHPMKNEKDILKEESKEDMIHQLEVVDLLVKKVSAELLDESKQHQDGDQNIEPINSKNNSADENSQKLVLKNTKKSPYHDYQTNVDIKSNLNLVEKKNTNREQTKNVSKPSQKDETTIKFKSDPILEKEISDPILRSIIHKSALSQKTCKAERNVVFLKTHKTGSSTILNIFQRYSDHHNLEMVLPMVNKGSHLFKWPYYFNNSFVFEYKDGDRYNLLANHARFHKKNMSAMMTRPNMTKFITVLREPVYQLESLYSYFKFHKPLKTSEDDGIWEFFKTVEKDRTDLVKKLKAMKGGVVKRLMKNPNAFDLGFEQWNEYPAEIKKIVATVQNDFNLVMISEYMMESLLLLKDELCWDLSDIVFFTMNKRPNKFRKDVSTNSDTIRRWSRIDYALYDHFNKTLWKKIAAKGETFQQELKTLKQMKKDLEALCLEKGEFYDKTQTWFQIEGYQIKKEARDKPYFQLCKQLTRSEIDYTMVLAEKQTRHGYKMPKKTKERLSD